MEEHRVADSGAHFDGAQTRIDGWVVAQEPPRTGRNVVSVETGELRLGEKSARHTAAGCHGQSTFVRVPRRRTENPSTKDVDGPLLRIETHLVVENEFWATHSGRVLGDEMPALLLDVVHVKIAL